jgi:hypothetical protein
VARGTLEVKYSQCKSLILGVSGGIYIWQPNNLCGGEIIREHCVQKYHSYKAESVRKT